MLLVDKYKISQGVRRHFIRPISEPNRRILVVQQCILFTQKFQVCCVLSGSWAEDMCSSPGTTNILNTQGGRAVYYTSPQSLIVTFAQ